MYLYLYLYLSSIILSYSSLVRGACCVFPDYVCLKKAKIEVTTIWNVEMFDCKLARKEHFGLKAPRPVLVQSIV